MALTLVGLGQVLAGTLDVSAASRPGHAPQLAGIEEIPAVVRALISEFRDSEIRVLAGWTGHRFRRIDGTWKISAKQVNLLNCDQCIRNPSIIL
jgi:hypothetical protein